MSISKITNFTINKNAPIDDRLVQTSSSDKDAILYKYDGLPVYQKDNKKLYIWDTSSWSVYGDGIYGGSGSLVDDTIIDTGEVGSGQYDTSNSLSLKSSSSNYIFYVNDKFFNNFGGSGEGLVEYKREFYSVTPTGITQNGPYISFNSKNISGRLGDISIGTGNLTTADPFEVVRITSDGKFGINSGNPSSDFEVGSTDNTSSPPITINQDPYSGGAVIGWNYGIKNDGNFGILNTSDEYGSSSIKFKTYGGIDIISKLAAVDTPTLSMTAVSIVPIEDIDSIFWISMDTSPYEWDGSIVRNTELVTIPTYLHKREHKFSKIQIDGFYVVDTSLVNAGMAANKLYITDDGNSFEVTLSQGNWFNNILIKRGSSYYESPEGTVINVRFRHNVNTVTNPSYIKVMTSNIDISSKIRSTYNDSMVGGISNRVSIVNDSGDWSGDVITFMKSDKWDIIGINRSKSLLDRVSSRNWYKSEKILIYGNSGVSTSTFQIGYLDEAIPSGYGFTKLSTSTMDALNGFVKISAFTNADALSPNGPDPQELNPSSKFIDSSDLRISRNHVGDVILSGTIQYSGYKIPYTTLKSLGVENIWNIGKISDTTYYPSDNSVFGFVSATMRNSSLTNLLIGNAKISINKNGFIMFHFTTSVSSGTNNLNLEICIPPIVWTNN